MEDLTARLCWELVKKEGYIAMWRKPLNNSCYMNRDPGVKPALCDPDDNPDDVWYVSTSFCPVFIDETSMYHSKSMSFWLQSYWIKF